MESWNVYDLYHYYLSIADKRVEKWLLMGSPWPTIALTLAYLLMVKIGPILMANVPPYRLKYTMLFYNLSISSLNLYIGVEVAAGLWWYYFSKLLEFMDTLFFILRKKFNQLTFLHVYHHSTMFCLWWIGVKYVPGGSPLIAAMLNSFVHVLMYTYYGLASLGHRFNGFLWWKKHLTIIQMAQFLLALVLGIRAIIFGCDFPMWMQYTLVLYMLSFIVLFGNFYYHTYTGKRKKPAFAKKLENRSSQSTSNGVVSSSRASRNRRTVQTNH